MPSGMFSAARFSVARNSASRRASMTNSGFGVVTTCGVRVAMASSNSAQRFGVRDVVDAHAEDVDRVHGINVS